MSHSQFGKIVIDGVGLMGGSLGAALIRRGLVDSVWGIGRSLERLEKARTAGVVTHVTTNRSEALSEADLVIVGLPVDRIAEEILSFTPLLSPTTLVTDMGSVKGQIVAQIEKGDPGRKINFIGSHPMCGSERTGFEFADADLYSGATCVVTPTEHCLETNVEKVCQFWMAVGGNILHLNPDEHDRLAARTSHLPRLLASALCLALEQEMDAEKRDQMVSTGFLGPTRTAVGDVSNWVQILSQNSDHVLNALGDMQITLARLHRCLAEDDVANLTEYLNEAQDVRHRLDLLPIARKMRG
jgi:prephenate dehydrogenase